MFAQKRGLAAKRAKTPLFPVGRFAKAEPDPNIFYEGDTMKRSFPLVTWALLLALISFSANLQAQFTDGDIAGTVTDPSGAAIIGATVTISNLQTGQVEKTQTDKIGYFRVPHLPPGTYQVRVQASGFKVTVLNDVAVNASATTPADAKLLVGTANETVEVIASAVLVQTEEGRLANTITTREVENLPLNGRQVYQLVTMEAGVTATNAPVVSGVPSPTSSVTFDFGFIANGSTPRGNNFLLDGTSNNNEWLGGTPVIYPSLDAIQEVQVQTLNFSAEFGRNNGAIVNIVTKSGTNDFHGSLFYANRNTVLNARNFFDQPGFKTPLQQNQFGFAFGGPIKRDKTFFFMDYEGSRLKDGAPAEVTTETPYTRSLAAPGTLAAMFFHDFPGLPCRTAPADPTAATCQAIAPQIERNRSDQYIVRVDHHFNAENEFFARWDSDLASGDVARQELFGAGNRGFTAPFNGMFGDFGAGYTHLFSHNTLNDLRFSFGRNGSHITLGMPGTSETADILKTAGLPLSDFAFLAFDDGTIPMGGELYVPRDFVFNRFTVNDTLLHTAGRHSFKFGFDFSRIQENSNYRLFSSPYFEFGSITAFAFDSPYLEEATVNSTPGSSAYGKFTDTPRHFRWSRWAAFVQDDWKVTSRLTMNLGVRWDVFVSPSETHGLLSNIILGSGSSFSQQIATATVGRVKQLWSTDYHNFAPRIGLSWDPFGQGTSVVRSGFSIAYNEPFSNLYTNASRLDPPEANTVFAEPVVGIGTTPIPSVYTFPFQPDPDFAAPSTANGGIQGLTITPNGVDPHLHTAYAMQWFLGVQHSFAHDYGFALNYVGTRGVGGYTREDYNRFDGDICNQTTCSYVNSRLNYGWGQITYISNESSSNYEGLNAQFRKNYSHNLMFTANYTYGKVLDNLTEGGLGDYTNTNGYGLLYSGVSDIGKPHLDYGPSEFDVRHRFTLTGVWNFPGPKGEGALKKVFGGWGINTIASLQSGRPFDVYCGQAWFNGCDFNMDGLAYDRPNRPAGIKTSGFSNQQFVEGLFGDPTLIYPAGTFYSRTSLASQTFCPNGLNSILDYGPVNSGPGSQCVPVGTNGNLSRNAFRGPAFKSVDLVLVKKTAVTERINAEFRAEAFNLFNRVNLYNPIGDLSSPQFGKSPAAFAPRQLQLDLKITF